MDTNLDFIYYCEPCNIPISIIGEGYSRGVERSAYYSLKHNAMMCGKCDTQSMKRPWKHLCTLCGSFVKPSYECNCQINGRSKPGTKIAIRAGAKPKRLPPAHVTQCFICDGRVNLNKVRLGETKILLVRGKTAYLCKSHQLSRRHRNYITPIAFDRASSNEIEEPSGCVTDDQGFPPVDEELLREVCLESTKKRPQKK